MEVSPTIFSAISDTVKIVITATITSLVPIVAYFSLTLDVKYWFSWSLMQHITSYKQLLKIFKMKKYNINDNLILDNKKETGRRKIAYIVVFLMLITIYCIQGFFNTINTYLHQPFLVIAETILINVTNTGQLMSYVQTQPGLNIQMLSNYGIANYTTTILQNSSQYQTTLNNQEYELIEVDISNVTMQLSGDNITYYVHINGSQILPAGQQNPFAQFQFNKQFIKQPYSNLTTKVYGNTLTLTNLSTVSYNPFSDLISAAAFIVDDSGYNQLVSAQWKNQDIQCFDSGGMGYTYKSTIVEAIAGTYGGLFIITTKVHAANSLCIESDCSDLRSQLWNNMSITTTDPFSIELFNNNFYTLPATPGGYTGLGFYNITYVNGTFNVSIASIVNSYIGYEVSVYLITTDIKLYEYNYVPNILNNNMANPLMPGYNYADGYSNFYMTLGICSNYSVNIFPLLSNTFVEIEEKICSSITQQQALPLVIEYGILNSYNATLQQSVPQIRYKLNTYDFIIYILFLIIFIISIFITKFSKIIALYNLPPEVLIGNTSIMDSIKCVDTDQTIYKMQLLDLKHNKHIGVTIMDKELRADHDITTEGTLNIKFLDMFKNYK